MDLTPDGRIVITTHPGFIRIYKNGALKPVPALDWRSNTCDSTSGECSARDRPGLRHQPLHLRLLHGQEVRRLRPERAEQPRQSGVALRARQQRPDRPLERDADRGRDPARTAPTPAGTSSSGRRQPLHRDRRRRLRLPRRQRLLPVQRRRSGPQRALREDPARHHARARSRPTTLHAARAPTRCSPTGYTNTRTNCQEIYAYGLRNPFRIAFDPNSAPASCASTTSASDTWEEVDQVSAGRRTTAGTCARATASADSTPTAARRRPGMTNPIHSYSHDTGCVSITGGDFVPERALAAPPTTATTCSATSSARSSGGSSQTAPAATPRPSSRPDPVADRRPFRHPTARASPSTTSAGSGFPDDVIRKIKYTGIAQPHAGRRRHGQPDLGRHAADRQLRRHAGQSTPTPTDALTYDWDFGDGSPHGTSATPAPHLYDSWNVHRQADRQRRPRRAGLRHDPDHGRQRPARTSPSTRRSRARCSRSGRR